DFAERKSADELVGPDRAEGRAAICRHSAGDLDPGDSRLGRRRQAEKQSTCAHEQELAQPVRPAKCTWLRFQECLPSTFVIYRRGRDGIATNPLIPRDALKHREVEERDNAMLWLRLLADP